MPGQNRPLGRVIVSGGASGLGAAIVQAVADAGGSPAVLDRDTSGVPDGVPAFAVDVADTPAVEDAVAAAVRELGGADAVVTAAGIDRPAPFGELSAAEWENVVRVDLFGTAAVVRAALPELERSHGRIVTVASSLALKAVPDATAYCAAKFGVLGFSRALAAELRGRVGLTTLIPSGMRTRFFDTREERYRPQDRSRLTDPAEVADAVVYALSRPADVELRELVICHPEEESWP